MAIIRIYTNPDREGEEVGHVHVADREAISHLERNHYERFPKVGRMICFRKSQGGIHLYAFLDPEPKNSNDDE